MSAPATVSHRLLQALRLRGLTKKELSDALRARGVKGSSENNVRNYLNPDVDQEPNLEFLRAVASELRLREAWLMAGHGDPDEDMESSRLDADARVERIEDLRIRLGALLGERVSLGPASRGMALQLLDRWKDLPPRYFPDGKTPTMEQAVEEVVGLISDVIDRLPGYHRRGRRGVPFFSDPRDWDVFLTAVLNAAWQGLPRELIAQAGFPAERAEAAPPRTRSSTPELNVEDD